MENKLKESQYPIIGVIGGLGPYAGLDFVSKIFSNTKAVKDQDHLDCLLVSCPGIIPDRMTYLLSQEGENPAYGMFESAKRLHAAGVRYASVACNTAHGGLIFSLFCEMVKESLPGLTIVNMLETCAAYCKNKKRLGLLATIGTHNTRLYQEYFNANDNYELLEPDDQGKKSIHEAIFNENFGIKAHSYNIKSEARERIREEINNFIKKGAEAVILGCTELPLAVDPSEFSIPLIDPGLLTARKLIELAAPEKLKEVIS